MYACIDPDEDFQLSEFNIEKTTNCKVLIINPERVENGIFVIFFVVSIIIFYLLSKNFFNFFYASH